MRTGLQEAAGAVTGFIAAGGSAISAEPAWLAVGAALICVTPVLSALGRSAAVVIEAVALDFIARRWPNQYEHAQRMLARRARDDPPTQLPP